MGKVRIAMNGANSMNCAFEREIDIVGELGYDCIELRDWTLADYLTNHTTGEVRSLLEKANLAPLTINAIEPTTLASASDRDRLTDAADWRLRAAAEIGCPYVVANCWGVPDGLSGDEGRRQVIEGLKFVSDMASEHGVKIAFEPLGSKNSPVHTVAETMSVLGEVDRDNVGWLFDVYHFHVVDGSLDALAESDIDMLFVVHIDDVKDMPYESLAIPASERLLPGDGVSDLSGILSTLHRAGYRGAFSVEMFNKEFLARDPYEFAKAAKEKTEAVLDKYFR
jgi:2-keto-myo-inositol isomerase